MRKNSQLDLFTEFFRQLSEENSSFVRHLLDLRRSSQRSSAAGQGKNGRLLHWRPAPTPYLQSTSELSEKLNDRAARFDVERAEAQELATELLELAPEERAVGIEKSEHLRSLALSEHLLQRSRGVSFEDPREGRHFAELGLQIARLLDPDRYGEQVLRDLCARAWSEVANTYRLASEFGQAERALRKAEALLQDTSDRLEKARFCNLKAALRKDQRLFGEALALRDRAAVIYRRFGEAHALGRTLNSKGSDYLEMGEPEAAITCLREAITLLDPSLELRTVLAAQTNLTLALVQQGRFLEASEVYLRSRPLYEQADPALKNRQHWLQGRIAAGLGRLAEAVAAFRSARTDFRARDLAYDFALVSLELALVYARQGQTTEVKRLAAEMMPIFKSRQIHREALAALTLFRQAVEQETLTVGTLRKIIDQLEKAPKKA